MKESSLERSLNQSRSEEENQRFRLEVTQRIEELFRTRAPLGEIARMMGAESFLTYEQQRSDAPVVVRFNVKGFVDKQIAGGTYLEPPTDYLKAAEIILPPDYRPPVLMGGQEPFVEAEIIPRSKYLIELLSEMGQSYSVIQGINDPGMMRKLSYSIFLLPNLDKAVLVNDEEGNATFVIHDFSSIPEGWKRFTEAKKSELKNSEELQVSSLRYSGDPKIWKIQLKELLSSNFVKRSNRPVFEISSLKSVDQIPEGWKAQGKVARELGVAELTVTRRFAKGIKEHPELFCRLAGTNFVYASPDYVASIASEFAPRENMSVAPEGWKTFNFLHQSLSMGPLTLSNILDRYRETNPEWFAEYLDATRKPAEYIHPDLVEILQKEEAERLPAPDGWLTFGALYQKSKVGSATVSSLLAPYRKSNPEWFAEYLDATGQKREHFHPRLVELVTEAAAEYEIAPEGWITKADLARRSGASKQAIARWIKPYRAENPAWLHDYLTARGVLLEHLHPELVTKLSEEIPSHIRTHERPPLGWMTNHQLAQELNRDDKTIRSIAEKYISSNPEWIRPYARPTPPYSEQTYYHPDLIQKIKDDPRSRSK